MSDSKHTGGEWAAIEFDNGWNIISGEETCFACLAELIPCHASIASPAGKHEPEHFVDGEELAANARLMAAAPELLRAMQRALRAFDSTNNGAEFRLAFPSGIFRALIAKATEKRAT